ncbi:MAG TPA: metallophosphoesterase [Solirubrobacterales bacterium]|nr:metallophosphoesterase [Solirubrobacterales bacterium]
MSERPTQPIRIAAAGDIHARESRREQVIEAFAGLGEDLDLILLAGDLTSTGTPEEARIVADACAMVAAPVYAVLGNHDWHRDDAEGVIAALERGGVRVLRGDSAVERCGGREVGIVGTKGFVGGFAGSHIPDFGEPSLRRLFAETGREVEAIDRGLREVEQCPIRIVLLHYSPVPETLAGERPEIRAFLGTDRLAAPIAAREPDLVLHGHAHYGDLEGAIGATPVYNVSVPVIGRDFWTVELEAPARPVEPIH